MKRWGKLLAVIVGAVIITALGIDAADTLTGSKGTMLAQLVMTENGCPAGMVPVPTATTFTCVDQFEASVGEGCQIEQPHTVEETARNVQDGDCLPVSVSDAVPWTYVLQHQAQALCAKAGKFLIDSDTWYRAALGTPDGTRDCNSSNDIARTGAQASCISGTGAYDMVGNVWEIVDLLVEDGSFSDGRDVAKEGYVYELYVDGLPRVTTSTPQLLYNNDYFWSKPNGTYALVRGGFYGSGPDAGIYSAHAAIEQNFSSNAIGFRCAISL